MNELSAHCGQGNGEKMNINKIVAFTIIVLVLSQISCSQGEKPITVRGYFTWVLVQTLGGATAGKGKEMRFGISIEDKVYILDFSAKTSCDDQRMKSLPYPKENGSYIIPQGAGHHAALQREDGQIIYFVGSRQYEVRGTLGSLEKAKILPLDPKNKQYFLLSAIKIKMLDNS